MSDVRGRGRIPPEVREALRKRKNDSVLNSSRAKINKSGERPVVMTTAQLQKEFEEVTMKFGNTTRNPKIKSPQGATGANHPNPIKPSKVTNSRNIGNYAYKHKESEISENESTISGDSTANSESSTMREESQFSPPSKKRRSPRAKATIPGRAIPLSNRFENLGEGEREESERDATSMEMEDGESNSNDQQRAKRTATSSAVPKPPPITTMGKSLKEVTDILIEGSAESKDKFHLRETTSSDKDKVKITTFITILTKDKETYDTFIAILKSKEIEYYSYTPKNEKPKTLVLKYLKGNFTDEEVKSELKSRTWENVEILKVNKTSFTKDKKSPVFLVQISNKSSIKELTKVDVILYQKVKWEPLRKNEVFQCTKCQRLGHASTNCALVFRCVKCGESHEPKQCKINKDSDRNLLKCANCGQSGHPANYRGCPYFKNALDIMKNNVRIANLKKVDKVNSFAKRVTPTITFADTVNRRTDRQMNTQDNQNYNPNRNPLPSRRPRQETRTPDNDNSNVQIIPEWTRAWGMTLQRNIIDALKIEIKNDIKSVNIQTETNTKNIKKIMEHLKINPESND